MRVGELHRLALARRDQLRIQHQVIARREVYVPLVAMHVVQLEIRVVSHGHRHGLGAVILDRRLHFDARRSRSRCVIVMVWGKGNCAIISG